MANILMRLVWLVTREQRKYIIVRHVPFDDDGTWRFDCVPPNCDACDECRLRYCCTSTRGALNITFSDYAYLVGSTKRVNKAYVIYQNKYITYKFIIKMQNRERIS